MNHHFREFEVPCLPAHSCVTMIRLCSQSACESLFGSTPDVLHSSRRLGFTAKAFGSTLTTRVLLVFLWFYGKNSAARYYSEFNNLRSRSAKASLKRSLSIKYALHCGLQWRYHCFLLQDQWKWLKFWNLWWYDGLAFAMRWREQLLVWLSSNLRSCGTKLPEQRRTNKDWFKLMISRWWLRFTHQDFSWNRDNLRSGIGMSWLLSA